MDRTLAHGLLDFIDGSPSPFHAVANASARLDAAGFGGIDESAPFPEGPGGHYLVRNGTLIGWFVPPDASPETPFRLVGAHTDSPNLRVKPRPDRSSAGFRQLGVEVYGGVLLNSWLDRDLGLSGRVAVDDGIGGVDQRLVRVDRPLLRVPQLAIHLDREIRENGLLLNPQQHLSPLWGLGDTDEGGFVRFLAGELGIDESQVLAWDLMLHDLTPSCLLGLDGDLLSVPRLDNLHSAFAATEALAVQHDRATGQVAAIALFDHEEVGSTSETGAAGALLGQVLERTVLARGGGRAELLQALAGSACLSADGAHATHPNYADRHEPDHHIRLNEGPALKLNANLRYATDSVAAAAAVIACRDAGVPLQRFVNRTDLPCGSTIGPLTAAQLGISTADLGAPQLAMHSARELGGADDTAYLSAALTRFLS